MKKAIILNFFFLILFRASELYMKFHDLSGMHKRGLTLNIK